MLDSSGLESSDSRPSATEQPFNNEVTQKAARRYATAVKKLVLQAMHYTTIIAFLGLLNWITFTGAWWFVWPALGFGLSLALQTISIFYDDQLGYSWQERLYRRRLDKLTHKHNEKH
jgi:two-component system, LytTR family, sensor kinase